MKFVVKEYDINLTKDTSETTVGICIQDNVGLIFPSPITNFIKREYADKGLSLNSQRNAAYVITRFLNFLVANIEDPLFRSLKFSGLKGLELEHAARYISLKSMESRSGKKSDKYVASQIHYIDRFYVWLKQQQITAQDYSIEKKLRTIFRTTRKPIYESIFELNDIEVLYPTDNGQIERTLKTFGENRDILISQFINCAREVCPEISLGIALQILAGLRRSEVINLTNSSISLENNGGVVHIRDNQNKLFAHLSSKSDVQVKFPRDQIVLCSDILKQLFDEHMDKHSKVNLDSPALFINRKTKKVITGKSYHYRFNKVKEAFLERLLKSNNLHDYRLLTSKDWSTHIGRGIFTNILLDLKLTPTQIALARGDRSINSALSYTDEHLMIEEVKFAIEKFRILLQ